ncbi:MAG: NUDIX domain-containing protein [Candidatus Promineifilaceae bacterium]
MLDKQTNSDSLPIQTLESHTAFSCRWYRVRKDAVLFPDGKQGEYNVVDVPPCVFIVPVSPTGEIVLIHHYRHTLKRWVWEIPAGGIEQSTPEETVEAELREEIGGTASQIDYLGEFFPSNGFSNEIAHFYIAWDVVLGEQMLESAEAITVHPTPLDDVLHMIRSNQLKDAPSALAILLAAPKIRLKQR